MQSKHGVTLCVPFGVRIAHKLHSSKSLEPCGWHSICLSPGMLSQHDLRSPVGADVFPSLSPRWRGDYGGKKQLWFPSNYVEEISSPSSLEPEREVSWGQAVGSSVCMQHAVPGDSAVLCSQQQLDENSPLGDLLGGVLDVPSCQIGENWEPQHHRDWRGPLEII